METPPLNTAGPISVKVLKKWAGSAFKTENLYFWSILTNSNAAPDHPLISTPSLCEEGVGDVRGVVDAKSDRDHQVGPSCDVDRQAPEVHQAHGVHDGEED